MNEQQPILDLSPPRATAEGRCPRCGGAGETRAGHSRSNPFLTPAKVTLVCDDCGLEFEIASAASGRHGWPW